MKYLWSILIVFISFSGYTQDLDSLLNLEEIDEGHKVEATFKGTRIVNGHSIETRKKGTMEFIISHRFGRLNSGLYELFGLDNSNIRFAFEKAITDRLTITLARNSYEKTYDGYVKFKLIEQKSGHKSIPVSITTFNSLAYKSLRDYAPELKPSFSNRLTYTSQLLIARKFNSSFSFQLTPTYVHFNTIRTAQDSNDVFAFGMGARVKLTSRVSINGEYFYVINPMQSIDTYNSLALGVDVETGGHVFQLIFTNSISMIEKGFVAETTGDFLKGDIHFGFNISRAF